MELRDLIVTPMVVLLVYVIAWLVRPYCTDETTRRYFLPGLTVRIIGALAVGFIYQFYYDGGDTYNFHTHGSRHVWEAFMDDPAKGLKLFLNNPSDQSGIYQYSSKIWFYRDESSFAIIRIAAMIDLFTFSTYSATAVIFACISFVGMWMFFLSFYKQYPHLHKQLAIASLFIPSVFFWGSGLLKDTITLACLGIATFSFYKVAIERRFSLLHLLLLSVVFYILFTVKIYILLTFLPSAVFWVFLQNFNKIRSIVLKIMLFPPVITLTLGVAFFAMMKAGEDNAKYSLEALSKTAQITAYDIRYWSGRDAGSGYTLGELDGTWQSMLKLAPQAINVSLFRPYIWEVGNGLMLFSAVESLVLFGLTIVVFYRGRKVLSTLFTDSTLFFCFLFSLTFAFAVGVSTYNFGTLTRYKIPFIPFYLIALVLLNYYSNKDRKVAVLDLTE